MRPRLAAALALLTVGFLAGRAGLQPLPEARADFTPPSWPSAGATVTHVCFYRTTPGNVDMEACGKTLLADGGVAIGSQQCAPRVALGGSNLTTANNVFSGPALSQYKAPYSGL